MIFARMPSSGASTSMVALSVSYGQRVKIYLLQQAHAPCKLTISNSTSPAAYESPSFFFHEAIPPSVMVGLIAGIENLDSAWRRAEE